jgi:beta-glucanase (GH16 family)
MVDEPALPSHPTRERVLKLGLASLASCAALGNLPASAQTMTPLPKRAPTDAERQAVRAYHTKSTNVVFQDDFRDSAAFATNWAPYSDDNSRLKACRTPQSLSVSSDGLAIKTISVDHCKTPWSTGEIISKGSWEFGFFEATLKIAGGPGLDNAFWLTSVNPLDDGTGDTFEIDLETYYPSLIRSTLHRHNTERHTNAFETGYNYKTALELANGFHDYGVLWTPSAIVFALDGNAFFTIETQGTVKGAMNVKLSTALRDFGGEPPDDPRVLTMQVSRLRVLGL